MTVTFNAKTSITPSFSAANKVYDGTTTASVSFTGFTPSVGSDNVSVTWTSATFANKNVGNGKTVTISGLALTGTDANKYTLSSTTATATANITARSLTVTATGVNKVYDGTTAATVTLSDNRVAGDVFTASYTTATFANKNVGNGKTISVSGISIGGPDAGNYTFNTTATATANITAKDVTASITAADKVYDGTTDASYTCSPNGDHRARRGHLQRRSAGPLRQQERGARTRP